MVRVLEQLQRSLERLHGRRGRAVSSHPGAHVDPAAIVSQGVSIGPGSVIHAGAQIGAGTVIGVLHGHPRGVSGSDLT